MSHHVQFVLLLVACLLLVWGLSDRSLRLPRWHDITRTRWLEVCLVAGLTLAALVLRLHDLEAIRAFVDELNFVLPARRFSVEADVPLLQPMSSIAAFPIIYPYFQSVASAAVESGLIGLRIPSAVFGALTVPALYFLGKQLFDWRVGLVAAVLLMTFPVHLQWSRLGMNNIADPLFGVLMLALLVRGVRRGGSWHFALAGICLGFTQYFYEGGRLVFLAVTAVWFLLFMLSTAWRSLPRRYIVVFLASALFIGGPIYLTLIGMDRPLTARFEQTKVSSERWNGNPVKFAWEYPELLTVVALLFLSRAEVALYYAGHYPYIHVYLLPALLLGLLILSWRWRAPAGSLLVVWIFGTVLAMTALLSGNNSSRLLVIMPAVMLVCALGIVETLRVLVNGRDWALRPTTLATALAISAIQAAFYFNVHLERFNKQHYQRQPEQAIAFWARDLPVGSRVHFMDPTWIRGNDLDLMVRTLNPEIVVSIPSPLALRLGYIANIPFRSTDIYFIQDDDFKKLAALNDRFVLSSPLKWTSLYSVIGVNYVAYMALADRHGIDR